MSTRWTQEDIDRFNAKKGVKTPERTQNVPESKPTGTKGLFALGRLKPGQMNKAEALYAELLEVEKRAGNVLWYAFEPMNLKLAPKCFYAVDFLVMMKSGQLECHEVKGGFITDDSLVKIKAAAAKFPFRFLMKKLVKGAWETREF